MPPPTPLDGPSALQVLKSDGSRVSSVFFMCLPDRVLVYGEERHDWPCPSLLGSRRDAAGGRSAPQREDWSSAEF